MAENENELEAHIVDTDSGEAVIVDLPSEEGDQETRVETELTRIEEIRAEATIAVAAIEADVETTRIEADAERETEWQREKAGLETSITELTAQIAALEARLSPALPNPLIPTPLAEAVEEAAEAVAETLAEAIAPELISTPQSIPENETQTEHGQSAEEESVAIAVAIPVPGRKHRRLI